MPSGPPPADLESQRLVRPDGLAVRRRRHGNGWSLRDLVQAIENACLQATGLRRSLTPNQIEAIEERAERIPYDALLLLAGGLDCDPSDLLAEAGLAGEGRRPGRDPGPARPGPRGRGANRGVGTPADRRTAALASQATRAEPRGRRPAIMSSYLDPAEARSLPGLRLVLTAGVPGPWGEAAKSIFHVKKIPYTRVRQDGGQPNEALVAWTGHANAPQAVLDGQPARTGWAEILLLAERMEPIPALLPADPQLRALALGLCFEICGEDGLGWSRRLQLLAPLMRLPEGDANPVRAIGERLASRYGYDETRAAAANARIVSILGLFSERLAAQRKAESDYLVGHALSAVDLYWSTFAALLQPLPPELCPMPEALRGQYASLTPEIAAALDPALLAHRDRIYREHLELPLDL